MFLQPDHDISFGNLLSGTVIGLGTLGLIGLAYAHYMTISHLDTSPRVVPVAQADTPDISDELVVSDAELQRRMEELSQVQPAAGDKTIAPIPAEEKTGTRREGDAVAPYRDTIIH